jgi:hypothetical protein
VIGYYVHHQGRGHLHRAEAIAACLDEPVTGLSSLSLPEGWPGDWVQLPRDDDPPIAEAPDPRANGLLHWVPLRHEGLSRRMVAVSDWIGRARPRCLVVDISVEIAVLARLHGVDVVTMAVPGVRDDAAHRLGYGLSRAIVGAWPPGAHLLRGVGDGVCGRLVAVGAISRFPVRRTPSRSGSSRPVVTLLAGAGGDDFTSGWLRSARRATPGWEWQVLGGPASWSLDPWEAICRSDVIVTHAGQNAIAEVAAARVPAVVLPQERPFDEQRTTTAVLAAGPWPAVVPEGPPDWASVLEEARGLDGSAWERWCDGRGAERACAVIADVAGSVP